LVYGYETPTSKVYSVDSRVEVDRLIEEDLEGRSPRERECHEVVKAGPKEDEEEPCREVPM
jgi:hypothetical protein